jgi:hypothetical protein
MHIHTKIPFVSYWDRLVVPFYFPPFFTSGVKKVFNIEFFFFFFFCFFFLLYRIVLGGPVAWGSSTMCFSFFL